MRSRSRKPVYCAAVDLGATSGRVVLGIWSSGSFTVAEAYRFPNAPRSTGPHVYWDVGAIWNELRRGLTVAAARLPRDARLASVGIDSWGCDYALVDDRGRLVFPVHSYRDPRTQPLLRSLEQSPDKDGVYRATGIPFGPANTSLQLAELVTSYPALKSVARHCLFLPSYFNGLLGGPVENELTIASTSQLLDLHSEAWSARALSFFGLPHAWFSSPVRAGQSSGTIRGISELKGTQLISVPGHDSACAYEALPAAEDGSDLLVSSGTWSIPGCESPTPLFDSPGSTSAIANERCPDGSYRPVLVQPGLWALERLFDDFRRRPRSRKEWSDLLQSGGKSSEAPVSIDLGARALANPGSMRTAIDRELSRLGLPKPNTLAGYVRLVCDSIGGAHARAKRILEAARGGPFRRILVTGGGSRNQLLCRSIADRSGLPVVPVPVEASAIGNIAYQFMSLGVLENTAALRRITQRYQKRGYRPFNA